MRGHVESSGTMFSYFSPESRVPATHPLRPIKAYADKVLKSMSRDFDELYAITDARRLRRSACSRAAS